jgi:glycerol-3-phosphate dehydrogenase
VEKHTTDVLIIGAGAVGTALARELSKFSLKVIVAERLNDVGGDASKANSAIVHCGFDAPPGSLESELVVHSNPMFDKLCSDLDIPFRRVGAILVAVTEEEEASLPALMAKARANHVYDVDLLTPDQVRELEPAVTSKIRTGLAVPRESIVDPFLLVVAQAENAVANGVEILTGWEILSLHHDDPGFTAESAKGQITARFVVNAAALFADTISGFLGIKDFKMHPRRGQFHVIDKAAPLGVTHIILPVPTKLTKGKILTPTIHSNWLIGPTAEELEDRLAHQTTREGLQEIVDGVRKLVPSVDTRFAITQYAGLRPVRTPGGYHIRTFSHLPGYLELSGIRSTGMTSSLAVARYACQKLIEMGMPTRRKRRFLSKREGIPCFREADEDTQERLIQQNPLYGRVVCRCETVTEAEVVQAIHRQPGARDIDGIKRRVRAGMGRCQGGFCGMRIPHILARELDIPVERVSKKGPGSEVLTSDIKSLR